MKTTSTKTTNAINRIKESSFASQYKDGTNPQTFLEDQLLKISNWLACEGGTTNGIEPEFIECEAMLRKFFPKSEYLEENYYDDESDYCEPVRWKAEEPGTIEANDSYFDRTW